MRSRTFIAIVSLLVLGGLASAQGIHVRVEGDTNLRDANSLEGKVVETIPAGTVLPVINWADSWLRVVRGRQRLWMADWVRYTLVEVSDPADTDSSTAATSTPVSQSESCCAFEWNCNDERARTSGYWAYRFRRCHVESPHLAHAFRVNNCCFLSDGCFGVEAWREGYESFQKLQCEVRSVEIEGSDDFLNRVRQAFVLLKDRAPVWYAYAISGLDSISEIPETEPVGVHVRSRRFDTRASRLQFDAPLEAQIAWAASVLAHEACHVHLYEAKVFPATGTSAAEEKLCTEVQLIVMDIIDPTNYLRDYLKTLIDNIHNPNYQWW